MKHAKGKWEISQNSNQGIRIGVNFQNPIDMTLICSLNGSPLDERVKANANLIVEAGNVANETGYTPRQLADQKAELLKAVEASKAFWDDMPKGRMGKIVFNVGLMNDMFIKMESSIKNATE
jgi:hypothetical protein